MSNAWGAELAKMFKDRENPQTMNVGVGTVLAPLPDLRIQFGEHVILTSEDLIVSASLTDGYKGKYTDVYYIDGVKQEVEKEIIVKMELVAGDEVILIPTTDKQTYYVLNKVGV